MRRSGPGSRRVWSRAWLGAMALASVVAGTGCTSASTEAAMVSHGAPLEVQRGRFVDRVLLTGQLEAAQKQDLLAPQTESWAIAIRWMAEDGAYVEQGDKVIELDNTAILEQISDYELAVIQAGIELSSKRASAAVEVEDKAFEVETQRIALAKAEIDAAVSPELVSRREYQQFQLAVKSAKSALATAKDELKAAKEAGALAEQVERIALQKAERKLESAEEQIEALSLEAPASGLVEIPEHPWEGRKLQVGDTVFPGMNVASLPDLRSMTVEAQLSDVDDGRIVPGMKGVCVLDAYPDAPIEARVIGISPVAREPEHQSARRFFTVVLELDIGDGDTAHLRPGLSAKVEILSGTQDEVLLVPRVALDMDSDPPQAALADGSSVEVELGACNAQQCVVLAGIDEGTALRPAGVAG